MNMLSLAVRPLVLVALPFVFTLPALAADTADDQSFMDAKAIKWSNAPPSLPKGAQAAVLHGDPTKEGPYVIRLKIPAGYKVPPHWHTQAENLTIISGTLYLGDGDKMHESQAHALHAGGFHHLPAKAHHYAFSKVPTVVQINGEGPLDIVYINEADDPRKGAKK